MRVVKTLPWPAAQSTAAIWAARHLSSEVDEASSRFSRLMPPPRRMLKPRCRASRPGHGQVCRKRVRRLMRKIGLSPIYQAPKTSEPHPQHRIYPYLLRHLSIERPNQVWCGLPPEKWSSLK